MGIFSEIWESLSRNRFRTAMTGFAVSWGIFILIILLGASSGLENGIQASYGNKASNAVNMWAEATSLPYNGLPIDRELYFTNKEAKIIRGLPIVELFSAVAHTSLTANIGTHYTKLAVRGVEGDYQHIFRKTVYKGRFINELDEKNRNKVCVIDRRVTEELGTDDLIGKYLQINDIPFLIVGICENGDNWEGATAHIPLSTHQTIFSTNHRFTNLTFTLSEQGFNQFSHKRDEEHESDLDRYFRQQVAASMQFDPADKRAVGVWSEQEMVEEQTRVMSAIKLFVLIIGICTLISGAVGVSNIMLVSVRERTKEFGIRKAIGAPPKTILLTVVGESLLITALFGYIGMLFGMVIVELLNAFVPQGNFPFRNPTVDMFAISAATTILIIVGVVAGTIPAVKAMKIKPIEAMNTEK